MKSLNNAPQEVVPECLVTADLEVICELVPDSRRVPTCGNTSIQLPGLGLVTADNLDIPFRDFFAACSS